MAVTVAAAPLPIWQILNNAGQPNVGGSVLTQVGSINAPTYQDSAGSTPLPNPIPLNSRGEVSDASGHSQQLFLLVNTVYTFTIFDKNGLQIDQALSVEVNNTVDSTNIIYDPIPAEAGITIVNANYPPLTVDRYETNAVPGNTDMSSAIRNAITAAGFSGGIVKFLAGIYKYTGALTLQSGVTLQGAGQWITTLAWAGTVNTNAMYAGNITGFVIKDLSLNGPGILSGIYCNGIFCDAGASNGLISRCNIAGFPGVAPFSYARGVTVLGSDIEVSDSRIENSTYCIVCPGMRLKILRNYVSNHYSVNGIEPWTTTSLCWDLISMEGGTDILVEGNYCTDGGTGGIYCGGNGGFTNRIRIVNNFVSYCWDRGIDNGLSLAASGTSNVIGNEITGNILYNNRNNNLWMAGVSDTTATGNTCIYDANYTTWASGAWVTYPGTHIGIGLFDGAAGSALTNCTVTGNTSADNTGNPGISLSYATNPPVGCTLSGNTAPSGYFIPPGNGTTSVYLTNSIDVPLVETITVVPVSWTGQTIATQSCGIRWQGKTVQYEMMLTMGTASTPSGNFVVTVPYLAAFSSNFTNFNAEVYNGWNTTLASDSLVAYVSNPSSGQVEVGRIHTGSLVSDALAFTATGCTIAIKGSVN